MAAEHRAVMREEAWQRRVAARAVELARPAWSRDLGQRPATVKGGRAWDRAVGQVVEYRQRWRVDDAERALGPEPRGQDASLEQRQARRHADRAIGRLREPAGDRTERGDQAEATGRGDHQSDPARRGDRDDHRGGRGDHEKATGRGDLRGDRRRGLLDCGRDHDRGHERAG